MCHKRRDLIAIFADCHDDVVGRHVAKAQPYYLRRRSEQNAEPLKILVLSDQDEPVGTRMLPDCEVVRAEEADLPEMG